MRTALLDECTPTPLAAGLTGVEVNTVESLGWKGIKNGRLVELAEAQFDILITADKNLRYQQNITDRTLAIIELPFNSWPRLREKIDLIQSAIDSVKPGEYVQLRLD